MRSTDSWTKFGMEHLSGESMTSIEHKKELKGNFAEIF
jgi:hypothetical protein